MNTFVVVALAFVALVAGQAGSPGNATMLTIGATQAGLLLPQLDSTYYGTPQLFYVYLPINTRNITISFYQPDSSSTACSDLNLLSATETYPCGSEYPYDSYDPSFYCYEGESLIYDDGGSYSVQINAGYYSGSLGQLGLQLVQGGYLYFAVNRYYSSDSAKTCTFTLRVDADYCPSGQIAVGDGNSYDLDATVCTGYTNVSTTSGMTYMSTFTNNGDDYDNVYRLVLPDFTGNVMVSISANDSFSVYGMNRMVILDTYASGGCYSYGSSGNDNVYTTTMTCTGVEAGNFYVYINSDYHLMGSINITTTVCSGGSVGPFCNSTKVDLSTLLITGAVNFTVGENGAYGCFDMNTIAPFINNFYFLYPVANSSYPDLYFGRGGFPSTSYPYVSFTSTIGYDALVISPIDFIGPYDSNQFCLFFGPYGSENIIVSGQLLVNASTATPTTQMMPATPTSGVRATTGMMPATPSTGLRATTAMAPATTAARATTGLRATTGKVAASSSSTSAAAGTTSTSGSMIMIPSLFLVAIVAMMF